MVEVMHSNILELYELREDALEGGGQKRIDHQHNGGKLTARERIDLLLDEGSFEELDILKVGRNAASAGETYPGDGVITGHGTINGREVFVFSQDFTVTGGSLGEGHSQKICKIMDLAARVGSPVIGLNDSGGARIQEGVDALAAYGEIFHRNVNASGVIPQISCIMGPCAGGAVYSPAITDFIFMVEQTSYMFVTGPNVVKTVIHKEITSEELGGSKTHASKSGVAQFVYPNDILCLRAVRQLISYLPSNNRQKAPILDLNDPPERTDPALDYLVPSNPNQSYDMNVLIKSILDGGEFLEVQPHYAPNIICGLGRLGGQTIGLVANQPAVLAGALDNNASLRARRFVRFCDSFNIPLVAWWMFPDSCRDRNRSMADHPPRRQAPLRIHRGDGAPNNGDSAQGLWRGLHCHEFQTYPLRYQLRLADGGDCRHGRAKGQRKSFTAGDQSAENPEACYEKMANYRQAFHEPVPAAKRGYIDDVIFPRDTRHRLIRTLQMLENSKGGRPYRKHGNIPL